jgi:hypothetical protein
MFLTCLQSLAGVSADVCRRLFPCFLFPHSNRADYHRLSSDTQECSLQLVMAVDTADLLWSKVYGNVTLLSHSHVGSQRRSHKYCFFYIYL